MGDVSKKTVLLLEEHTNNFFAMNPEKLRRLQEKVRTGGKGSVRRKRKTTHKGAQNDDNVIHFSKPRLQVAQASNMYVVSGISQTKTVTELLPDIVMQLPPEKQQQLLMNLQAAGGNIPGLGGAAAGAAGGDDSDDEVPALVTTDFEKTAADVTKKEDEKKAETNVEEQD